MTSSVFAGLGVYKEHDLIFQVPTGYQRDPETGNFVPGGFQEIAVKAWLQTASHAAKIPFQQWDQYLQKMVGADRKFIMLHGRLTEPSVLPEAIKSGMKAKLTLLGEEGDFQLGLRLPEILDASYYEDILGEGIMGAWIPS